MSEDSLLLPAPPSYHQHLHHLHSSPLSYPGRARPITVSVAGGGRVSVPMSPEPSAAVAAGSADSAAAATHFNLDQLVEIVQSFQLDTVTGAAAKTDKHKV